MEINFFKRKISPILERCLGKRCSKIVESFCDIKGSELHFVRDLVYQALNIKGLETALVLKVAEYVGGPSETFASKLLFPSIPKTCFEFFSLLDAADETNERLGFVSVFTHIIQEKNISPTSIAISGSQLTRYLAFGTVDLNRDVDIVIDSEGIIIRMFGMLVTHGFEPIEDVRPYVEPGAGGVRTFYRNGRKFDFIWGIMTSSKRYQLEPYNECPFESPIRQTVSSWDLTVVMNAAFFDHYIFVGHPKHIRSMVMIDTYSLENEQKMYAALLGLAMEVNDESFSEALRLFKYIDLREKRVEKYIAYGFCLI